MTKKRIVSIVMLLVLAVGIAMAAYGVTGTRIYENAAAMMGTDKKSAQDRLRASLGISPLKRVVSSWRTSASSTGVSIVTTR